MRPCCMEVDPEVLGRNVPNPICYLIIRDTDLVGASERQPPSAQRQRWQPRSPRSGRCGSKPIADHALVSADRRLDLGPQIVAAGFLPGHAAAFGDHPQMAVTLCRGSPGRSTRHRACPPAAR
jgi:hypothetical protein